MPLLLIFLALSVYGYLWLSRRNSTLTRACKWRLDRRLGPTHFRCADCGAVCDPSPRKLPNHCLRPIDVSPDLQDADAKGERDES